MVTIAPEALRTLLEKIPATRIAVLGDFCLDVYWTVDPRAAETSLETGLDTRPVARERCALGGAGNVVNNLLALGCRHVHAFGVVGDDPWGRELLGLLQTGGVNTAGLLTEREAWSTLVYVKPHIHDEEHHRFDFGNFNALPNATAEALVAQLEAALPHVDLVIVNQQVLRGIHTPFFRARLAECIAAHAGLVFLVDSRHHSDAYPGAFLKLNDHEAARLIGVERAPDALVLRDEVLDAARTLQQRGQRPVFITRGARGIVVADDAGVQEIPGIQVLGKIDTVGAGDSVLAGLALGLAAKTPPTLSAAFGGLVAAVTVRKLRQTGTATTREVLDIGREPDYVYSPELAEDARAAHYHEGSEIEIVTMLRPGLRAAHVILDHDGTLSSLRQGWEAVMEPMMVRAILGSQFEGADESLYRRVLDRVRDYIDASTGVQTLAQMQGLVDMVAEFGCVPTGGILDAAGYKQIYNDALMERVRDRLAKLSRGELGIEDFTIKNAVTLLHALHAQGVRLYLASGTDEPDVCAEAEALGYAHVFEGRIYGAVGDVTKEAKREVLDRILQDIGQGAATELVTFGDGPIEIRETRRRGGFCVGIASDEVRRFGPSATKRTRLIRAGADLIVPDFSQLHALLPLIGLHAAG